VNIVSARILAMATIALFFQSFLLNLDTYSSSSLNILSQYAQLVPKDILTLIVLLLLCALSYHFFQIDLDLVLGLVNGS
jgi:succinate dehydrogenase/fumarate reductase cytochrome b subunit